MSVNNRHFGSGVTISATETVLGGIQIPKIWASPPETPAPTRFLRRIRDKRKSNPGTLVASDELGRALPRQSMPASAEDLIGCLRRGRNQDGGWGYYAGKRSRLEPTVWAALALPDEADALERWPSRSGLLLEQPGGDPNYGFHGLALLAMLANGRRRAQGSSLDPLFAAVERAKGVRLPPSSTSNRQDNSLQGWSWIPETFSWVEPTAWCMLALKKRRRTSPSSPAASARIEEAERLLINRSCVAGGWNYGNADVMGKDLRAYVPTTAIALLAMQDRRDHPVIRRSADYLTEHAMSERSGTALALASIALAVYGRRDDAVRLALAQQLPVTIALGNHAAMAMAAYALAPDGTHAAFTI
jgi:hypothetical protein